ncbi:MAG TPA: cytosine permease [Phycisphaerae bacterium]|jgi:hypothetical protein|nr:cytosine permease [Phycisphaerae bacterium]HOB75056.1 cytosine permease [Phycisphaerae bacterium]HOJ54809.1 cytosine permease [Phycisphaerae bacterium]HOL26913.1 cytosine permease [Phycisphaerae bacterium]HPP20868.1 cytosine permease [Phycisphaerae bacterium]
MAAGDLPAYLTSTKPNPLSNRAPWYKNTAQAFAGIFLWFAFYDQLAGTQAAPGTLAMGGLGAALLGLLAAGLICHFLFYLVPGMLGMKTGYPLYIVGTSTFGTKGGYFLPGIFMGLLQIGWYSVATYYATKLVLAGFGLSDPHDNTLFGPPPPGGQNAFSLVFVVMAVIWGYLFAFLGGMGVGMVARVATYFPIVPIVLLILAAAMGAKHLGNFDREQVARNSVAAQAVIDAAVNKAMDQARAEGKNEAEIKAAGEKVAGEMSKAPVDPTALQQASIGEKGQALVNGLKLAGFLLMIQLVVGFTATAAACGADFCSANRNADDVQKGGLVGITLAILFAGGLAMIAVAGAQGALNAGIENGTVKYGQLTNWTFQGALGVLNPKLGGQIMPILFALGSVASACFCSFIIGNSLSTMLAKPKARVPITMAGATIGIVLAALGVAGNLAGFFGLIGASFGPVIGAMVADYLLSGRKWAGPREGVSIPGYAAWLVGFVVGISNNSFLFGDNPPVPGWFPTGVASLIVGFIVYAVLAKAGLEGRTILLPTANAEAVAATTGEPAGGEVTANQ